MAEPKPTASLSSGLLARKGGATPAMRRPAFLSEVGHAPAVQDDLGWNDMGYDVDPDPDTPMDHDHNAAVNPLAGAVPEAKPEVRLQLEMIAQQLQAQPVTAYPKESIDNATRTSSLAVGGVWAAEEEIPEPIAIAPEAKGRAAPGSKGKAAFTLRLDKQRHLKLRLACAVSNKSAQNIVTEALDALLETMPEVGQLAANVPNVK
jgi:hypothetical protein